MAADADADADNDATASASASPSTRGTHTHRHESRASTCSELNDDDDLPMVGQSLACLPMLCSLSLSLSLSVSYSPLLCLPWVRSLSHFGCCCCCRNLAENVGKQCNRFSITHTAALRGGNRGRGTVEQHCWKCC